MPKTLDYLPKDGWGFTMTAPPQRTGIATGRTVVEPGEGVRACRYDDCPEGHRVAVGLEQVTCPTCREYLGLPPLSTAEPADDPLTKDTHDAARRAFIEAGARCIWTATLEGCNPPQTIRALDGPDGVVLLHDCGDRKGYEVYPLHRAKMDDPIVFALEWMGLSD